MADVREDVVRLVQQFAAELAGTDLQEAMRTLGEHRESYGNCPSQKIGRQGNRYCGLLTDSEYKKHCSYLNTDEQFYVAAEISSGVSATQIVFGCNYIPQK